MNLRKKKWLLCCSFNPHKNFISNHVEVLRRELDDRSSNYENILLLGDLNPEMTDLGLKEFCNFYWLKNLLEKPICFKTPDNPNVIDLLLTNRPRNFRNSDILETRLSDFHKLTLTVLKSYFKKQAPKMINYRNYNNSSNEIFCTDLIKVI